ncbi:hypothetical protein [Mycolicibacterium austroafricanum]|uniref:hypothetical protein n=1 Tax=Mycolicibacterium austroafricanum TaxID=39687 RepID=UPI001CA34174|nr:hypothetical protein [Mycolicibacterium austroafricanum]QZT63650.1 hypothetical protein JN085_04465 [Mycolicibacterium austroafricanum]
MTAPVAVRRVRRDAVESEPKMLAFGLVLAVATSGTARGLLIPGLKLSDILLILTAVGVVIRWGTRWKLSDGLGGAVLLYVGVYMLMTLINFGRRPELELATLPYEMLGSAQYALIFVIAFAVGQHSRTCMTWLRPSMIIASIMSLVAVLQVVNVGPVRQILAFVTGRDRILNPLEYQAYRGSGIFASQHALGMYLCLHAVIAAVIIGQGVLSSRDRRLLQASLLVTGVGILSTVTGTPALIYAIALVVFVLSTRNAVLVFGGATILSFAASFTPIGDNVAKRLELQFRSAEVGDSLLPHSFWFRVNVWQRDFIPIIEEHFWTGYGPVPADSKLFPHKESMYITVLIDGGTLLLLALAVLLGVAFLHMNNIVKTTTRVDPSLVNPVARAMRFMIVMLAIFMAIHPYLSDAGAAPMFFTALGIVSGLAYRVRCRSDRRLVPASHRVR